MAALAWVLAILGAFCAIMGIVTAVEIVPPLGAAFTVMFWLALSAVLFLACIASAIGAGRAE